MMDSSSVSGKPPRSANPRVAIASTARKKVTIGIQCKETLSPELQELSDQQDREQEEWKKRSLNPKGGVGAKGGHAPTPLAGANPVLPQAPGPPPSR